MPSNPPYLTAQPNEDFNLSIPFDTTLLGVELCTQGFSFDAISYRATNAPDIVLGTY